MKIAAWRLARIVPMTAWISACSAAGQIPPTAPLAVQAHARGLPATPIKHVVIIVQENRSFDNLFGTFPGANGLNSAAARDIKQVDRDGHTVLTKLPPAWGGMTAAGQTPAITQAQTTNVWPNAPFQVAP